MNRRGRQVLKMVGVGGLAGLAALPGAQAATQITFDGFQSPSDQNADILTLAGFGSNGTASDANHTVSLGAAGITGTPDISLAWGAGYQLYPVWDGRGTVA